MRGRWTQYGAALLLVHLAACSDEPQQPAANRTAAAPAAAPIAPQGDRRLVVALGDSLFAGYGLAPNEGFAPALERALAARGIAAQVVNAGVSGDTSMGGRQRLAYVLDGLPRKPDLVIVGLGANDMLRGQPPAQTRTNLDAILAELRRREIRPMLTGMLAAPNLGRDYAAAFDAIYPDLARRYDAPLYPFFLAGTLGNRDLMLPDGIHPNSRGVEAITAQVVPLVAEALPEDGQQ